MPRIEAESKFLRLKWRLSVDRWRSKAVALVIAAKDGFDPNQPRVPAGNPDGGQWTGSVSGGSENSRRRDPDAGRLLSDPTPDNIQKPSTRLAQARGPRVRSSIQIGNRRLPATIRQATRYDALGVQAQRLHDRVREIDPNWKPRPSAATPQTAQGAINERLGVIREAEARIRELATQGIGPGPFAKESIPARGSSRSFRIDERNEINLRGYRDGCHTCGSRDPGTPTGNFIPDHQLPSAIIPRGQRQRLYPQCAYCSSRQGGFVGSRNRKNEQKRD